MARALSLLLLVLERLNRLGPERFRSARNSDSNIIWSITICFVPRGMYLWYVARDLAYLLFAADRLIRLRPYRRRTTHANEGNVFKSISGCSRNGTWNVPLPHAIQLDEIASRTQAGSSIGMGKQAFDSPLREEDDNIGSASSCIKLH